jgi:23S rRNA G2445 N2-methylase RlmL
MDLYAFIDEQEGCPASSAASSWLRECSRRLDLHPALEVHASLGERSESPSFRVTASRSGDHEYRSPDIAAWTGAGIQTATGWRVDLTSHDYDIQVDLVGGRVLFGLRLGGSWVDRRRKPVYHPASLNPTVAFAMLRMCGAHPDDVFLDPACGGGTLLAERAAVAPARALLGGDIWPRALDYARRNLAAAEAPAMLVRWDAGKLPLRTGSVDQVASNLPFGHRVGRGPTVRDFYRRLIPELTRVLRSGARAALLTSRRRWLNLAIRDSIGCRRERSLRIVLGGKEAFVYVLSRES